MIKCSPFLLLASSLLLIVNTPVLSEDILQVYSDAASGSLRFKSASVDYQIAEAQRQEIMAEYDPQLNLKVTPSYKFTGNNNSRIINGRLTKSSSNGIEVDYSLGLHKPLYHQQLNARISQAGIILEQEEALLDLEKQALIARVAENYFAFLMAQNKLDFSFSERNVIAEDLKQLRTLYRLNHSTITDIKETESRLDQANSSISIAKNGLDRAKKRLRIITGRTYDVLSVPDINRQRVQLLPARVDGWLQLALNNSLEIVTARDLLAVTNRDVDIQRAGKSTTVDLFARYEGSSTIGGSSDSDNNGKVGLEINIPLFLGNKVTSKVLGANYKYKKSQYDLELVKRKVHQNVTFSYQTILSDIDDINALKHAVSSLDATVQSMKQGQLAGTRTMSDVLSSLRESFQVKRQYTNARYKYLLDIIKLKQAAGILSVDDLRLVNLLLKQPNAQQQFSNTSYVHEKKLSLEDAWK